MMGPIGHYPVPDAESKCRDVVDGCNFATWVLKRAHGVFRNIISTGGGSVPRLFGADDRSPDGARSLHRP